MLGYNYIKFDSMNHVILFKKGKVKKEGRGLSFFYYNPVSSIVSIPIGSKDLQFVFKESTKDYQEVTVQGQVTFKVVEPQKLADCLDFTVDSKGRYLKDDHEKIQQRISNEVQTASSSIIQKMNLRESLRNLKEVEEYIFQNVQKSKAVLMLGIEITSVNVLGVTPNPEMSRALEAQTRESLQKEADQAIYERRNFAVEQERVIKESELNTEIAVEQKQKQIAEKQMETEVVKQNNEQELKEMEVKASISLEEKKQKLIALKVENQKKEADAKEYMLTASLKPYKELDWKTLMAINSRGVNAKDNIALAFRELAENADKIGSINISPELLSSIIGTKNS
ncbi:SPFH domain-containing protein [Roseivirga pacifica]|uniref:SPFH domain-containing protein n=1 Tax=Roseivirga pacifica TaxID=1267423 RepID=UPI0020956D98|nr:SPFH domain-containing protein [Roseivirga pacifica]MCO6358236.1 membrane protease subunit, stomatin/prohibitin [Roseivirga pacifica]MCO6366300.1 membrane protease subunit, stomatin/prohibitin [Roseivirga pacifica]MCO6369149.1 membrane protease subunit, stomatin/prohibitin [Roseivirga pacifica]MCO6373967.1 membrane protease subunit, stomatin/prohibitin [Roseivirga pacifica]MCO6378343.1 membrane protease subunit, stomatin/prohibitin [Roseivirga pacifica]